MAWSDSTVTNTGLVMLNELLAGCTLTITSATGGTGIADPATLIEIESLQKPKQELSLLGIENQEQGKRIKIQITSTGLTEGYQLQQVAVYAALDKEEQSERLFIMQDEKGIWIPSESETPGFVVEMYAFIAMTNDVKIQMIATPGAMVSVGMLQETIDEHNKDPKAHPDIRAGANFANAALQELLNSNIGIARTDIIIPTNGWETDTIYPYHCDIAHEQVTAEIIPLVTILPESMETAQDCSLAPCTQTMDGILRVYADTIPTSPIQASVALLGVKPDISGSIGAVYEITIATPEEGKEMLEEAFDGEVIPDISGTGGTSIASATEAKEMMDETFAQEV